jgi:hypothetical protein
MITNEHPLYGMERLDRVERALQRIARVRKPEKVIAKLASQLGRAKDYGKLTQRQRDRLVKSYWSMHDRIGLHVANAERRFIKILGENGKIPDGSL